MGYPKYKILKFINQCKNDTCHVQSLEKDFYLGTFGFFYYDFTPLAVVNRVGLPRATLPTLLNFPHSHAFTDGGLEKIWDSHSFSMEDPITNEKEQAMGFHTSTTSM
jgi:hypothetical protein